MKTYTLQFSSKSINDLKNKLILMQKLLTDEKFKEYIGKKCLEEVNKISVANLTTIKNENIDDSKYIQCNNYSVQGDIIYIYNDSMIDLSTKTISEENRANYPGQLSLAKIVEFGIGYTGSLTETSENTDWQYDIGLNKDGTKGHGYKGWYYIGDDGEKHWTNGFRGRLIFYKLKKSVEENINEWIVDYIDKNMKD